MCETLSSVYDVSLEKRGEEHTLIVSSVDCPYCSGEKSLINTMDEIAFPKQEDRQPGINVVIDDGLLNVTAIADTYEPNYQEQEIEINYCPVCGRKRYK